MKNLIFFIPFYGAFIYANEKVLDIHPDYFYQKSKPLISLYDEFVLKAILVQLCLYFYIPMILLVLLKSLFS